MGAESYVIDVGLNQALFGFGDAVCVPVVEWIATNYLNPVFEEQFALPPPPLTTSLKPDYARSRRRAVVG